MPLPLAGERGDALVAERLRLQAGQSLAGPVLARRERHLRVNCVQAMDVDDIGGWEHWLRRGRTGHRVLRIRGPLG